MLVKGMFNLRPNWTLVNSLDEDTEVNFVWTQKYTELNPSDMRATQKEVFNLEASNGYIDTSDMSLLKQAWDKVEGKSRKKIADYNTDNPPLLNNVRSINKLA